MSIKCSLLGHDFGETTVERQREEEGTKVVITITEMETCSRCGEVRVVSENKEVTTLETPERPDDDPTGGADDDAGDEFATAGEEESVGGTDAVILDDDSEESSAQAEARGAETTIPDAEGDDPITPEADPSEEDAVIIGDAEHDDRDPGEWPGEDGDPDGAAEPTADGHAADDDRNPGEWPGEAADPAERADETDEVEILDAGPDDGDDEEDGDSPSADDARTDVESASADVGGAFTDGAVGGTDDGSGATETTGERSDGRSLGAWPEEESASASGDAMGEWPEETLNERPSDTGASGPGLDSGKEHSVTVPEGKYKCPECGSTADVESSSLRAGDFCPECHRGTLLQHENGDGDAR